MIVTMFYIVLWSPGASFGDNVCNIVWVNCRIETNLLDKKLLEN